MYLMFDNAQLAIETVVSIGKIIHHDFSDEIKEMKSFKDLSDPPGTYGVDTKEYWKNKYLELLEDYNKLLKKKEPAPKKK